MTTLTQYCDALDTNTAGLPVTKQGVTNIMEMSGSTSNAMLMYYVTKLPATGSFPNQAIFNGQDGHIYVWNDSAQVWTRTGVTAFDELSGYLQAGQLLLGNQLNICTNGCFTNDTVGGTPNGWSATSTDTNAPVLVMSAAQVTAGCPTQNCMQLQGRDTYFTAGNGFDVKGGENYYMESYFGSNGTTPGMSIGLYFPAVGSNGPLWAQAVSVTPNYAGWGSASGVITVPSWANRAMIWAQVNANTTNVSDYGYNWLTGIECVKSPATLQSGSANDVSFASGTTTTILSTSFTTGYASIILVRGRFNTPAGSDYFEVGMNIDGAVATTRTYVNPTATVQQIGEYDIWDIVTTPGLHTIDITGYFHNAGYTGTANVENILVLNLHK